MRLRYAGTCRTCGTDLPAGTRATYHKSDKYVTCLDCPTVGGPQDVTSAPDVPSPVPEPVYVDGIAGASARAEFEKRHAARDKRVRERFPRAGGFLLAMTDDPQSTRAWDQGAVGEEKLGEALNALAGPNIRMLHDRRIPGTRANIDHIAITGNGVLVVDAKRYAGRPRLVVEGRFLRPRTEKLTVAGRDRTKLVDGVLKQVQVLEAILAQDAVQVRGVLCFIGADWPLVGGAFETRGVAVVWPKRLYASLREPGPLTGREIDRVHATLRAELPER